MSKYILQDKQFIQSYTARYLIDGQLSDVVSANNKKWSLYHDDDKMAVVAICDNKPRDLPVYGLAWEELIDEQ